MPYIFNHLVLIMNSDFVLCGGQTEFLYVIWNRDVKFYKYLVATYTSRTTEGPQKASFILRTHR